MACHRKRFADGQAGRDKTHSDTDQLNSRRYSVQMRSWLASGRGLCVTWVDITGLIRVTFTHALSECFSPPQSTLFEQANVV